MLNRLFALSTCLLLLCGCGGARSGLPSISGHANDAIPQVVQTGQFPTNWAFFGAGLYTAPNFITRGAQKNLWVSDEHSVWKIDMFGNATQFPVPVSSPGELTVGPDGNLWFVPTNSGRFVGRMTTNGGLAYFSLPGIPWGIATGPDGNLWVTLSADFSGTKGLGVASITPFGAISTFQLSDQTLLPREITAGPDGNLWFTAYSSTAGAIGRITPSGTITIFPGPVAGGFPYGIAAGSDGNLWFTELTGSGTTNINEVGKISLGGVVTMYAIPTPSSAAADPGLITAGPLGSLWFVENGNGTPAASWIFRVTTSGVFTANQTPDANVLRGIAAGPDGNLWFTEPSSVGVFIVHVLNVLPSSLSLSASGPSQTIAVSETHYSKTWTATSSNPTVASVSIGNTTNTFVVQGLVRGYCTIMVKDLIGNAFPVQVIVQ